MRILILGEGPTDVGLINEDHSFELEGPLPAFVRKILGEGDTAPELELRGMFLNKVRLFSKRRIGPSRYGYPAKLEGILGLSQGRQADVIVAVVDRDGEKHKDRIEELNRGREVIQEAGKNCAVGLAIESIEAWLLADEKALREILEDDTIHRQPDPESLSSRNEQSAKNPKGLLKQLLEKALNRKLARSDFPEFYARIAQAVSLDQVKTRCPLGFCPFCEQVEELKK